MSDLIAVADTAWSVRRFLHLNLLAICSSLDEPARPEFVELINALNEHMPLSEDGKDWLDDTTPQAGVAVSLGKQLRAEREKRRLSLRDAAAEIGVSFNTLSRVEHDADCLHSHALAILRWLEAGYTDDEDHSDDGVKDRRGDPPIHDEWCVDRERAL